MHYPHWVGPITTPYEERERVHTKIQTTLHLVTIEKAQHFLQDKNLNRKNQNTLPYSHSHETPNHQIRKKRKKKCLIIDTALKLTATKCTCKFTVHVNSEIGGWTRGCPICNQVPTVIRRPANTNIPTVRRHRPIISITADRTHVHTGPAFYKRRRRHHDQEHHSSSKGTIAGH